MMNNIETMKNKAMIRKCACNIEMTNSAQNYIGAFNIDRPLVSFIIPSYNSENFMRRCIDSLLCTLPLCEILIINDGSSDNTSSIAKEYAEDYENVFAIDQENRNWGGVINHGLELAQGIYYKVVDSDDYLDQDALIKTLRVLGHSAENNNEPDLLITNYVYDHIADGKQRSMEYHKFFPTDKIFHWEDLGRPGHDKFIMIHAAWYKTSILKESNLKLPEGVSYMDSIMLLHPMPWTKTLLYLNIDLYHYIIGREGQSVEIDVVKKHIDQQLYATHLAIQDVDYRSLSKTNPNCATIMMGYISCMLSVSTIYLFMIDTPEALKKNQELWDYLKETSPTLYENMKHSIAGRANRKSKLGRSVAKTVYAIVQRIYKFA